MLNGYFGSYRMLGPNVMNVWGLAEFLPFLAKIVTNRL